MDGVKNKTIDFTSVKGNINSHAPETKEFKLNLLIRMYY
jgi:hypothetical protein